MTSAYLSAAGLGALALVVALVLHFKKYGKKIVPWLMLLAGFSLAGSFGGLLDKLAASLARSTESASARLLGVGLPLIISVIVALCLLPHMKPKGQPPTKFTPWLALVFPALLATTGLGALAALVGSVSTNVGNSAWATLSSFVGGF
jgi:hypothetical protein